MLTIERAHALYDRYVNALVTLDPPTDFGLLPLEDRVAVALGIHNARGGDRIFWAQQDFLNEVAQRMADPTTFPADLT